MANNKKQKNTKKVTKDGKKTKKVSFKGRNIAADLEEQLDRVPLGILKEVLSWDYLYMLTESKKSGQNRERSKRVSLKAKEGLLQFQQDLEDFKKLSEDSTFDSADQFEKRYSTFLLEECRCQLMSGWDEPWYLMFKAQLQECTKREMDTSASHGGAEEDEKSGDGEKSSLQANFLRLQMTIESGNLGTERERYEEKEFHNRNKITEGDVVLLTQKDPNEVGAGASLYFLAMALRDKSKDEAKKVLSDDMEEDDDVIEVKKEIVSLVVLGSGHKSSTKADLDKSTKITTELENNKETWYLSRICNLTTTLREYEAVKKIGNTEMGQMLLDPTKKPKKFVKRSLAVSSRLRTRLQEDYNKYQLDALDASLEGDKIVLIQGPPGTGKTKLVVGLISTLIHSDTAEDAFSKLRLSSQQPRTVEQRRKNWLAASPWIMNVNPGAGVKKTGLTVPQTKMVVLEPKKKRLPRILVCTPSNSALDEIVIRVKSLKLVDDTGIRYNPRMVRLGTGIIAEGAQEFTLVELAKSLPENTSYGDIVKKAHIVFSTLNNVGSMMMKEYEATFDFVIVDEAAQAVEPSTLIPISESVKKLFLVGDPQQLPATITSMTNYNKEYQQSLFKRLESLDYPVQRLRIQHRMHPEIRHFPSEEFYNSQLEDSPDVLTSTIRPWHRLPGFGPFAFYHVEERSEFTYESVDQADFAVDFVSVLKSKYPEVDYGSIGIIATYIPQKELIEKKLMDKFGEEAKQIEVLSVDAYQGREKDIILWTTVRSGKSIGFLRDRQRVNVGLTRAKSTLIVVGNEHTLQKSGFKVWDRFFNSAKQRGNFFVARKQADSYVRGLENQKPVVPRKKQKTQTRRAY